MLLFGVLSVRLKSTISGEWLSKPSRHRPRRNRPFTYVLEFRTESVKSGGPERKGLRRAIFARLRVLPVNRSDLKTPGNLPLSAASNQAESTARMETGGQGGIRTLDTLLTYTHFPGARLRPLGHLSGGRGT